MKSRDIKETQLAMKKVEKKYGKSAKKAGEFLAKMGYLTKNGKVARGYSTTKTKVGAAS